MWVGAGQEHDVSTHHQWSGHDEEDVSTIEPPGEQGEKKDEEGPDHIRRDGVELLRYHRVLRVDCLDDGWQEKRKALDGDVVEEEDEGGGQGDRAEDATENFDGVDLVEHLGGPDTLRLDSGNGEILLFLAEPPGRLGTVGHGEKGNDGQATGDDAFDGKDHAPLMQTTEMVEGEDGGSQKAAKGTGQRSHDDVKR